ncbi:MAG: radical SAM protein [Desulfovibrionaceae bacterium]|jgi:wyosine [tRNA(Phe)-imidazoG37] synthetase (radical SAM superfamily)|nr:radical SAM protein [Desulfovibrionaceae bacterium]
MKYVFGPVTSSRLGRSLGLDLLAARACTMDCLYCEVGRTDVLTRERAVFAPAAAVLDELAAWVRAGHEMPDYVTLGGMGEPCLNADMGAIIDGVREICPSVPVAVLTNSTLMADARVRAELGRADAVLPSMDSLVEAEFRTINRPAPGLTAAGVAEGLLEFARGYAGRVFLEVLLAAGINDSEENLELLRAFVARLGPDRVDVVTMSRPGAYARAHPVDAATLARWRAALTPAHPATRPAAHRAGASTEPNGTRLRHQGVVPDARPASETDLAAATEAVRMSLARRPQTCAQIARAQGLDGALVKNILETLRKQGHIRVIESGAPAAQAEGEARDIGCEADGRFYGPVR